MSKRIVVLGSTGSVGRNVLDVVERHKDRFDIVGLSAGRNTALLEEQLASFPKSYFSIGNEEGVVELESKGKVRMDMCCGLGEEGLEKLIERARPDLVVNCLVGFVGFKPTVKALHSGISVVMANKESIVAGGEILSRISMQGGAKLIPVDSEHAGISQCLRGQKLEDVRRVYLTASGGALREKSPEILDDVGVDEVLDHPTWSMGDKITVDSATLMNKGLEVIEAHWLFGLPYERLEVVIHPQSIVHAVVEFRDGSLIAQMGSPDMRLPILWALSHPERIDSDLGGKRMESYPPLTFEEVDVTRYPCLELALEAARQGGNRPAVLNGADEEAVRCFLEGKIPFSGIHRAIRSALESVEARSVESIEDIVAADTEARRVVRKNFAR